MKPSCRGLLCAWLLASGVAWSADPPRVEQLSNPQSQTVGKKFCAGPPPVWVPYQDACPGSTASGAGGGAPAVDRRETLQSEVDAYQRQQRERAQQAWSQGDKTGDAMKQAERALAAQPPDVAEAFYWFRAACSFSDGGRGCGRAGELMLDYPLEARRRAEVGLQTSQAVASDVAGKGCRLDRHACFVARRASIEAGIRPPWPDLPPADMPAFEQYLAERQEASRLRASAQLAAQPAPTPATMSPAGRPAPSALPTRLRTAAEWIAEHKKYKFPGPDWMQMAVKLEPDNAEAHHLLGQSYVGLGMHLDRAVAAGQRATTLEPGNALYWRGYGVSLARSKRWDEAAQALQKSVDFDADDKTAWQELLDVHRAREFRAGNPRAVLDRAVANHPDKAFLWQWHAELANRRGDRPVALASYQKLVALDPEAWPARSEIGRMQCEAGRRKEALSVFEAALDRRPDLIYMLEAYNRCRTQLRLPVVTAYTPRAAAAAPRP